MLLVVDAFGIHAFMYTQFVVMRLSRSLPYFWISAYLAVPFFAKYY